MTLKKIDLFGIGSAIVDTEVLVTDKFLKENKIQKGSMTLVTESYQNQLIGALKEKKINFSSKSGGSICNSIVTATMLGTKSYFCGKLSNDSNGDLFMRDLSSAGVGFFAGEREPGVTGRCLVLITDDSERTMCTFLGSSEQMTESDIQLQILTGSQWFFIEGYLLANPVLSQALMDAVKSAKACGVRVALSLSDSSMVQNFKREFLKLISFGVDLIFCNRSEAFEISNSNTSDGAAEVMKSLSESFVITEGADGALICDGDKIFRVKAKDVRPVDTTGAGDMFAGAFMNGILSNCDDYKLAGEFASVCAGKVVTQFGPRLNSNDLKKIKLDFY